MAFSLVAPFLTDDPAFARGVRYGILYQRLQRTKGRRVTATVTEEDEERTRLMAHRIGWRVRRRKNVSGWICLTFVRVESGADQLP